MCGITLAPAGRRASRHRCGRVPISLLDELPRVGQIGPVAAGPRSVCRLRRAYVRAGTRSRRRHGRPAAGSVACRPGRPRSNAEGPPLRPPAVRRRSFSGRRTHLPTKACLSSIGWSGRSRTLANVPQRALPETMQPQDSLPCWNSTPILADANVCFSNRRVRLHTALPLACFAQWLAYDKNRAYKEIRRNGYPT